MEYCCKGEKRQALTSSLFVSGDDSLAISRYLDSLLRRSSLTFFMLIFVLFLAVDHAELAYSQNISDSTVDIEQVLDFSEGNSVELAASNFILTFPLNGYTAYNAPINSVFDHSMAGSYVNNNMVVAYTGEKGESIYGSSWVWGTHYGFKNSSGTPFTIQGNYTGGGSSYFLYYDGHPGYDYRTTSLGSSVPVLAAAPGIAHRAANIEALGEVYIDHQNGYTTHYLHLVVSPSSYLIADNTPVSAGTQLGIAGGTGGFPVHLHFEVRYNGIPVDPYGWQGSGNDPYSRAVNINLWGGTIVSPPPSYEGFIDAADCSSIRGWAWDRNQPNTPINVDIYDGSTKLATIAANAYRKDLADNGKGNGNHAFSYATPSSLKNGVAHSVSVKYAGTGTNLYSSPKSLACSSTPTPNNAPIAEAAVSKSPSGPYYYGYANPLTVTKGQSVNLYFFADKDVNGDAKASLDPDGWTNADNGVSSGGKCEWNRDLNQGTPTFETVIYYPAVAGNCNIGPYPYTFNDVPGTYEYQILRITDRKSAQSNVSKIKITVVDASASTPSYEGFIDSADCSSIRGWAWNRNQPNTPINVDIYDGSTKLATVAASTYRSDLVSAGKGNGNHGFSYATPSSLKNGVAHSISVKYAGTGTSLGSSPKSIICSPSAVFYSISGTIHSGSNAGPTLSGATVSIAGKTTTSSSTGAYSITGISAGTYALAVSKSGYDTYTNPAYYIGSNQTGKDFYLTQPILTGSISGRLHVNSAAGSGLSSATVTCGGRSTTTNSSGDYSISNIPPGSYTLRFSKSGYVPYSKNVSITAGQNTNAGDNYLTKPAVAQTPMSGPPGTTFVQWGTGFSPNSTGTWHCRKPNGSEYTPWTQSMDSNGHFEVSYTFPSSNAKGNYTWWIVDGPTGIVSNTVTYTVY